MARRTNTTTIKMTGQQTDMKNDYIIDEKW